MIRTASDQQLPGQYRLLYSCRSQDDIPFYEELLRHEQRNPRFRRAVFVTQGPIDKRTGQRVLPGRITGQRLQQITGGNYNRCTYLICGPRPFIQAMTKLLLSAGTDPARIISEDFMPAHRLGSTLLPKDRASRLAYAFTAAGLVLGSGFIAALDLARFVPRYASAASLARPAASAAAVPATTTPTTTDPASSTASSPSTNYAPAEPTIAPSIPAAPAPTAPAPQSSPQPTTPSYYQPPMSSVS